MYIRLSGNGRFHQRSLAFHSAVLYVRGHTITNNPLTIETFPLWLLTPKNDAAERLAVHAVLQRAGYCKLPRAATDVSAEKRASGPLRLGSAIVFSKRVCLFVPAARGLGNAHLGW